MLGFEKRRLILVLLFTALLALHPAYSKDGDSGSNSGSGSSDGGSENSGSGNRNDDSDDDDDRDEDDGGDDDNDDDQREHSRDQERALSAYKSGKVVSLLTLKKHLKANYPGKVLRIDLNRKSGTYYYKVRMLGPRNRIQTLTLHGLTLKSGRS